MTQTSKPLKLILAEKCKDTQNSIVNSLDSHYKSNGKVNYELSLFEDGELFLHHVIEEVLFGKTTYDLIVSSNDLKELPGLRAIRMIDRFKKYEGNMILYHDDPEITSNVVEEFDNVHFFKKSEFLEDVVGVIKKYKIPSSSNETSYSHHPAKKLDPYHYDPLRSSTPRSSDVTHVRHYGRHQ